MNTTTNAPEKASEYGRKEELGLGVLVVVGRVGLFDCVRLGVCVGVRVIVTVWLVVPDCDVVGVKVKVCDEVFVLLGVILWLAVCVGDWVCVLELEAVCV